MEGQFYFHPACASLYYRKQLSLARPPMRTKAVGRASFSRSIFRPESEIQGRPTHILYSEGERRVGFPI
jgi:hypothetical protein